MAVELGNMQSAEPRQCGSCQHFERRNDYDSFGLCKFKLPPWVAISRGDPTGEVDYRTVGDTDGCTLYEAAGSRIGMPDQFVQKRYWGAGTPSR